MQSRSQGARCSAGFTLIELVIAVVIFSFLAFLASALVSEVVGRSDGRGASVAEDITLVAMLLRLAGVALLLFGAGFWYLVELHEPGRLDSFRLAHFLLLALTYSLFFTVFAVLGSREIDAWIAVGIAAVVSYPLLVLHVSTIVGFRFAVTMALPLAVLSTALVVNGVYGGAVQSYVHLGLLCVAVAFLTLTYPRLASRQDARRTSLEQGFSASTEELAPQAAATRTAVADARALLALQDPVEHDMLRQWIERRIEAVNRVLDEHEQLISLHDAMRSAPTRLERRTSRLAGVQLAARVSRRLPQVRAGLQEAAMALADLRRTRQRTLPHLPEGDHCIACGFACGAGARYCPACGIRCAEAKSCRKCEDVLRLPLHLLARADGDTAPVTHCIRCGERHAG
jgi:prepilin-type N-terminal cleavage/methylation domain-containing protein